MDQLSELDLKVNQLVEANQQLQATVDKEQAEVQSILNSNTEAVNALKAELALVKEQLANGATPDQLAELTGKIEAQINNIAVITEDVASTVTPEIVEEPVEQPGSGEGVPSGEGNPFAGSDNPESSDTPVGPASEA